MLQPDEFIERLNTVKQIFYNQDVLANHKVKFVAIELKKKMLLYGRKISRNKENEKVEGRS